MFRTAFTAALLTLLFAAPAPAKELVDLHESQALRGASADGDIHVPLNYQSARDRYRTDDIAPVAVGPINLKAGDIVDLRLMMQYANDNSQAKGAWTVMQCCSYVSVKSEHWSLYAMGASGIRINDRLSWDNSDWAMPQHEQNFDNYQHYMTVDRSAYYRVTRDRPNAYFFPRTYFISSAGYTIPGSSMRVVGDGYTKLQVAIYR